MSAKEVLLWALRKRRPWRVQGDSMEPEYSSGDLVLIDPTAEPVSGDVIVARHPFKNLDIIKYVKSVDDDGYLFVESPGGDDSQQFGRVPAHTVNGVVTYNWKVSRNR